MSDHPISRKAHKLPPPRMTIPSEMRCRPRCAKPRPYRRSVENATLHRARYEAVVDVQLTDGTVFIGYPLNPAAPMTRFQARKLLKRYRRDFPNAYCMVTKSFD
ncbi:hypothetical protein [Rhodanobacter hydrolyticus]|uniref:KTSC domain-containing protein n=1 Tax=Rhodanobacter hydrolyticus TaxID=2250595 RepID=A0ABW8J3U6_9GAMM